jgi:hypothetical protein
MGSRKSRSVPIEKDEITPKHIYQSRRQFLKQMGVALRRRRRRLPPQRLPEEPRHPAQIRP